MRTRQLKSALLLLLPLLLTGCAAGNTASGGSMQPSAASSMGPSNERCPPVDLRTPSGVGIDLTGTWTGDQAIFLVAQIGDCVWWEELSAQGNRAPGERFRRVFSGKLQSDFTIVGRFAMIYVDPTWAVPAPGYSIPREGEAVYHLVIRQEGSAEVLTLEGPARESVDFESFRTVVLTQISDDTKWP